MLSPAAALRRILDRMAEVGPLPAERVSLREALGRALAEDVVAPRSLPPFDNSQMDGYALRAADAPRAGARLKVALEVFAGDAPAVALPPGTCARVFTGAPLPAGADAVEMQEEVSRRGVVAVFRRRAEVGRFVRPAGADVLEGAVALTRGSLVDPGAVGLAAALGRSELPVHRRPRVAILPTGNEIVPIDRHPAPGQIVDSNSHALAAAALEAGAVPLVLPMAGDDRHSLRAALEAASGADVLVTTGGVSVGEKDLVRTALQAAGARLALWQVALRPGKPFAFGTWGGTAVFGLPGNPVSSWVTFELFVRPALRALAGLPGSGRLRLPGRLSRAQDKPRHLTLYLRVRARPSRGGLWLDPLRSQQSGHLTSAVGVDALAILPAGLTRVARGTRVDALWLRPPAATSDSK
ncbi:MAG TPA: gephyrin-like molybdotransferase Glp [Anaeromyxobacteraceae bacterium]|nr:gephyrin-like molybdotransferase Glp [Anaeromyxobacteraceae bacterium]